MKWKLACVVLALSVATACKKDKPKPGDDDDDNGSKTIAVEVLLSDSGGADFFKGECVAFRITGTNTQFQTGNVSVELTLPEGSAPADGDRISLTEDTGAGGDFLVNSATEIDVGAATFSPCFYLSAFWENGLVSLEVIDGTDVLVLDDVFNLTDTPFIDLGAAAADGSVDSVGHASARANVLEREGDFDYYRASGDAGDAYYGYFAWQASPPSETFFLDDVIVASDPDFLLVTFGHQMALWPNTGGVGGTFNLIAGEQARRGGSSGFDYTVEFRSFTSPTDVAAVDTWDDAGIQTLSAPGLYRGTFTGAVADYDPSNGKSPPVGSGEADQAACVNTRLALVYDVLATEGRPGLPQFDDRVYGGGLDVVYQLEVPDGQTAYVHSFSEGVDDDGNGGDLVLYALADPATDIPIDGMGAQNDEFAACVAAVDQYGAYAPNTSSNFLGGDGLWITNDTGSTQTYYLFVDQFTDGTMANYAEAEFLLWVEYR